MSVGRRVKQKRWNGSGRRQLHALGEQGACRDGSVNYAPFYAPTLWPRKDRIMRHAWTSKAGLRACSVITVLLLSNVSWAQQPKATIFSCKCTCRFLDELGKEHFGPSGAVAFTESSLASCLGHSCTVQTKTGTYSGTTRDCTGTEKTGIRVPPGGLQTLQPSGGSTTTIPRAVNIPGSIPGATR